MAFEKEISAFSIVLIGAFNPRIFSPQWLLNNGLLTESEFGDSSINLILPDVAQFRMPNFEMTVETERCVIAQIGPAAVKVFDFAMALFGDVLVHTPLTQAGLNWEAHYRCESWAAFHAIGDRLAPKDAWGSFGADLMQSHPDPELGKTRRRGGLRSITMEDSVRPDGARGAIRVTAEPSVRVECGLFVRLNDHFEIDDLKNPSGTSELLKILSDKFDSSQSRFEAISLSILG